ncbi:MAG: hypothetical protein JXM74_02340 [Fusobacteriaceae bacterium]|nr:hypothetical protein [Fusobacteriaceae bacterium]MBN2837576.1 hypothetical protein [Fusobacteriaceae bacterium]
MENIEKLKRAILSFEEELKEIESIPKNTIGTDEKMKLDYRKMELLTSIENIEKYLKRLEFVEKVKNYENSSRNAQR